MIITLVVSQEKTSLSDFEASFQENDVQTVRAESGQMAFSMISEKDFDLVVADEELGDMTGLELVEKVVSKKPMMNFAVVSALTHKDFHEASEGLGVLMQLPVGPNREHAANLLGHLKSILKLTTPKK